MSVTDNGCGIPEESLSKVTEPFYRVDKARNRDKGGAGLGLALCKQIAEIHGAVMNIESLEGRGTVVKITFTTS
jgi:signal transduction histidine kinase